MLSTENINREKSNRFEQDHKLNAVVIHNLSTVFTGK